MQGNSDASLKSTLTSRSRRKPSFQRMKMDQGIIGPTSKRWGCINATIRSECRFVPHGGPGEPSFKIIRPVNPT